MSARALGGLLVLILPFFAQGIETKVGRNLSGSMPKVTLTNPTIFPQTTTLTVFGAPTETFLLDAHSSTEIFVECHASEQTSSLPLGVNTSSEAWTQQIPSAQIVSNPTALWISSQRQGRAHLEALMRSDMPTIKLLHLGLSESPKNLAELAQIAMILISAGDLERLTTDSFEIIRGAVALGVPLIIAAREKSHHKMVHQSVLTTLRFGAWQSVSSHLGMVLPAATRIAGIQGATSLSTMTVDDLNIMGESTYGFGWVRLLAVPFATLREGDVTTALFGNPKSRMAHPTRWLESQIAQPVNAFFVSWIMPLSGLILLLMVVFVRRSHALVVVAVVGWWGWMITEPVADQGVLMSKQWGIEAELESGGVVLTRMDVDHRLGGARLLDVSDRQLDLKMLRTGAACLIHRELKTKLLFPQTLDRMTRIFIGYGHLVQNVQKMKRPMLKLPEWPRDEFSGSILQPVLSSQLSDGCEQEKCAFYRIVEGKDTDG